MSFGHAIRSCTRCIRPCISKELLNTKFLLPMQYEISKIPSRLQSSGGKSDAPTKPRKAPLTAYQIFVKDRFSKQKTSDIPRTDALRKVAVEWQSLTEEEKGPFYDKYAC